MKKGILISLLLMIAFAVFAQDPPVEPEPGFNWWTIVSVVLAGLGTFLTVTLKKVKSKLKDVISFGKESLDVLFVGSAALEDNNIDAAEVVKLKAEIAEAKAAWQKIWNKG